MGRASSLVARNTATRVPRGDEPPRVEIGRCHGKAALGHQAQHRAAHRAKGPQPPQGPGQLFTGPVLQKFDEQVSPKQEGQCLQGVDESVQ